MKRGLRVAHSGTAGGETSRHASLLAVVALCLLLLERAANILIVYGRVSAGAVVQVCFTAALFAVPLLCPFRRPRRVLARYRWVVLAVQAVLTWVPFAVFGGRWQVGIGGLLAGLVLLSAPGWPSWLAAGALLAADVTVRAWLTGLPWAPDWSGALWAALAFVDDTAVLFGMVRLIQLVGEVQEAQERSAWLAVTGERLRTADQLRSAVDERLAGIAAAAEVARRVLAGDSARALAQVTAAGAAAREAVAQARALAVGRGRQPGAEQAAAAGGVVGARLARAVLVVVLCGYAAAGLNDAAQGDAAAWLIVLLAVGSVVAVALQLHHSRAAWRGGRARGWPLTLGLQAVLAYAFFLPPVRVLFVPTLFLGGAVLLVVPSRWRWAGYAAVVVIWVALAATVPMRLPGFGDRPLVTLYDGVAAAFAGLFVYALSRLAGMARELEALRGQLARMAAVRERLRVARDVHDLLGLGLSAIALKADLIRKLIGRDDARAAAEIEELSRICVATRADVRLVAGDRHRLSLVGECAAARQILASAGIRVDARAWAGSLPPAADEVLAPVLREAVTNILRHSAATSCQIDISAVGGTLRLAVSNDGVTGRARPPGGEGGPGTRGGSGLANLTARVQAVGGRLTFRCADGRFELTAELPLPSPVKAPAGTAREG
jgi:two-component system, NarL family, sensor histidine kinase DesK